MKYPKDPDIKFRWWPYAFRALMKKHMKPIPPDEAIKRKGVVTALYFISAFTLFHYFCYKSGILSNKERDIDVALRNANKTKVLTFDNFKLVCLAVNGLAIRNFTSTINDPIKQLTIPVTLPLGLHTRQAISGSVNGNFDVKPGANEGVISPSSNGFSIPSTVPVSSLSLLRGTDLVAESFVRAIAGMAMMINALQNYAQTGSFQLGNVSSSAQSLAGRLLNFGATTGTTTLQELSNEFSGGLVPYPTNLASTPANSLFISGAIPVDQFRGRLFNNVASGQSESSFGTSTQADGMFGWDSLSNNLLGETTSTSLPEGIFGWESLNNGDISNLGSAVGQGLSSLSSLTNVDNLANIVGQSVGTLSAQVQPLANGTFTTQSMVNPGIATLIRTMFTPLQALSTNGAGFELNTEEPIGLLGSLSSTDPA